MVEAWAVFTLVLFGDVKTDSGVISLFVQFTWISVNAYKPEFKLKKKKSRVLFHFQLSSYLLVSRS